MSTSTITPPADNYADAMQQGALYMQGAREAYEHADGAADGTPTDGVSVAITLARANFEQTRAYTFYQYAALIKSDDPSANGKPRGVNPFMITLIALTVLCVVIALILDIAQYPGAGGSWLDLAGAPFLAAMIVGGINWQSSRRK